MPRRQDLQTQHLNNDVMQKITKAFFILGMPDTVGMNILTVCFSLWLFKLYSKSAEQCRLHDLWVIPGQILIGFQTRFEKFICPCWYFTEAGQNIFLLGLLLISLWKNIFVFMHCAHQAAIQRGSSAICSAQMLSVFEKWLQNSEMKGRTLAEEPWELAKNLDQNSR